MLNKFKIKYNTFSKIKLSILTKPRKFKRLIVVTIDLIFSLTAVYIAFYLRTGEFLHIWEQLNEHYLLPAYIGSTLTFSLIFYYFKIYKVIFRYLDNKTFINITKACLVYGIIYSIIFTLIGVDGVPRTIGVIQPLIFFMLIGFSRFFSAYFLGNIYEDKVKKKKKKQAIIYGAGDRGYQLSRTLSQNSKINIVGFFDDDITLHGNKINGLDILNPDNLDELVITKNVSEIIFAFEKQYTNEFQKAFNKFKSRKLTLRVLPSYEDFIENNSNFNNIRELSIDDILGREIIEPDPTLMKKDITNKVVLVTGAGGSIGGQLSKEILINKPRKLILLDHSEFALYNILKNLNKLDLNNDINIIPILGSVTNKNSMEALCNTHKPNTIYHAAAYKHVNLVEENIVEGVNNNVFGTLNLAKIAIENNVRKFVLISTDKAVRPSNIMGASKRVAEMILQALSDIQERTIFSIVRFGNVLGSSGSVVPLFRDQIKMGGPVTVTHKDVSRYFMTIAEAAQLVIQAGAMTNKAIIQHNFAPIFLLEMGKPIKIFDLAKLMIELSGFTVYNKRNKTGDIEIKIIGLRPGEKLHEELLINDFSYEIYHPKIKHSKETFIKWDKIQKSLSSLEKSIITKNDKDISELIFKLTS